VSLLAVIIDTPSFHRLCILSLQAAENAIQLANAPYGISGAFAVNIWMRRNPGSDTSGKTFQYIFSHTGIAAASGTSPNQVSIYVADSGHPAYGTVRAIVKDSNDVPNDLVYLDSDGRLGLFHEFDNAIFDS